MSVLKHFKEIKYDQYKDLHKLTDTQKKPLFHLEDFEELKTRMSSSSYYDGWKGGILQMVAIHHNDGNATPSGIEYSLAFIPNDKHGNPYTGTGGWFILLCPRGDIDTQNGRTAIVVEDLEGYEKRHITEAFFTDDNRTAAFEKLSLRRLPSSENFAGFMSGINQSEELLDNIEALGKFNQIANLRQADFTVSLSGLEAALASAGVDDLTPKELLALYHHFFLNQ